MRALNANRVTAVLLALVATGYLVMAFQLPRFEAVTVPVQPSTLPRGLGAVLLLLSVLLFFQRPDRPAREAGQDSAPAEHQEVARGAQAVAATAGGRAPEDPSQPAREGGRLGRLRSTRLEVALFAAAMCLYVGLLVPLGFVLSTIAYVAGTAWYFGYRRHLVNVTVSAAVAVALYAGLTAGLDVALPSGPLPF